jgi:gliding motility-associated-like protein
MKKYLLYPFAVLILFLGSFSVTVNAQESSTGWSANFTYQKAFIENKGQFPYVLSKSVINDNVLYAVDNGPEKIYFTKNGIIYNLVQPKDKDENEAEMESERGSKTFEEWEESEKEAKHPEYDLDEISFTWENSNPDVEVVAEDPYTSYYSYSFMENKDAKNVNFIKGYKKIIYKNLYDNVDVEFTFHPENGIKYALILHPGADASKIKMICSDLPLLESSGDVHFSTIFGDIIDHAPKTFYTDNSSSLITSKFVLTGNTLGFTLDSYDITKSITIDPWVVSPNFNTSTAVWEVETDASGNVYVIGGETPMQLRKFNAAGTAGWIYVTPWDTASVWLGTLATDDAGNSFITSGTAPEMERIDNAGNMIWHNAGSAISDEWWSITFNCDKTKLIVGGTILNMLAFEAFATIFDMDINSGSVIASQNLAQTSLMGIGSNPIEVRSISSSMDAKYIFLTHNDVGAINQNIGVCPTDAPIFQVDNGHNLSYKCENYLPATQNGGGLKALIANDQFIYVHSGSQIQKRSLANGSLITSVALPGGASSTDIFGKTVVECSGLAVDDCGNVYAGSTNQVVKYDANLSQLSTAATTFHVYDVSVNSNGEVLAVGATSDNQAANRSGKIQSLSLSACAQFALVCCDANICTPDTVCATDAPFNLSTTTSGGTFSGTGITNATNGTFDPSVSGAGTFTITYTQACGSGTTQVVVLACATLTICQETNGDLTVTGGTGPYTWSEWVPGATTPITNQTECEACSGTWTPFVNLCMVGGFPVTDCASPAHWATFTTGTTVTPPGGADTIMVGDAALNSQISYNISLLPNCSSCTMTSSITASTQPSCGTSNGSATVTPSGGTGPFTYNWNTTPPQTTQIASGIPAGTYTVTVTDAGACTSSATITLTNPNAPTIIINTVDETCVQNNGTATATPSGGTGPYTYSWNTAPVQATQTATGLAAGTYSVTVTDALNCTGVQTCTINDDSYTLTASAAVVTPPSCGSSDGAANVTPSGGTGPYTYSWNSSPVQTTQTATGLPAGNYSVTVTDASSCTGTASVVLANPNAPTLSVSTTDATCGMSNGSAVVTPSGGTSPYTYSWNTVPAQTTQSANNLAPGTYSVTVTDDLNCTAIISATIVDNTSFSADAGVNQAICEGDSTILTATGGTNYQWNTGGATASINVTPLVTTTYTVTVSDGSCTATDNVTITVNTIPVPGVTGDTLICFGSSTTLTASGGNTYLWNTADTTAIIIVTPVTQTTYNVTVSNSGCTATANITIFISAPPTANAGNDTTINIGTSAQLDGSGGVTFSWSPAATLSCTACPDPVANPLSTTTYVLTVTDASGCTNVDTVIVTVDMECGEVFVPNAFSPNSDGQNEFECVYGNCIKEIEFAIFDRWGEKVFYTEDPKECWDGKYKEKDLNTGAFVYYMKAILYDGSEVKRQGNINLFR